VKKWICTICSYTHHGDSPPDTCPICGAQASAFKPLTDEASAPRIDQPLEKMPAFIRNSRLLSALINEFPLFQFHPIMVHFPNGLIPTSFLFLLVAAFFNFSCMEPASFYLVCAATAVGPLAVATGIYNWRTRYKTAITFKLMFKLIGGIFFVVLGAITVVWRLLNPEVAQSNPAFYFALNVFLLLLVTLLGHIGGGLVFARHRS
jgi:uncharacterized membrane protein/rubredoxin